MQIQEEKVVQISYSEMIYRQGEDLGKRMDRLERNLDNTRSELNQRMDRIEKRMDKLEERLEKQDEKIDRLADKIDELHRDITTGANHGQISNIATIGIALAVIYAVLK